ncbi:hypothetical protein PROFUN_10747 [Planoprotostelium fungivorum]|uniref:Uncharacterized protein n=1 Tax=Planoprotostelium fungivorum TaxID=1890364 RepID=A0A2P6N7Y6_9EUKA|nr:hypothetical protein PROFUN_10747 [Planoprotostelium fungivorum]
MIELVHLAVVARDGELFPTALSHLSSEGAPPRMGARKELQTIVHTAGSLAKCAKASQHVGDVAQMVEHSLSMRGVQGSIPCFSTPFYVTAYEDQGETVFGGPTLFLGGADSRYIASGIRRDDEKVVSTPHDSVHRRNWILSTGREKSL